MSKIQEESSIILKDKLFKYIFANKEVAEDLIKSIFDYLEIKECYKIKSIDTQRLLPSNKNNKKDYYGDLVFTLENDNIVSLEVCNDFGARAYKKSLCYLGRIYSSQLEEGDQAYEKCHKVYSINIVNSFKKGNLTNRYVFQNIVTNEVLFDGDLQMIFIAIDKVKKYEGLDDMKKLIQWLRWMMENAEEKRNGIVKEDKPMTTAERAVKKFFDSLPYQTEEEYDAWRKEYDLGCARLAGREEVIDEVTVELLKMGLPIDKISEITKLGELQIQTTAKYYNIEIKPPKE